MAAESERRTQLLRGALDTCLLALLAQRPTYAYDLVVQLQRHGLSGVGYGTIYPLMARLRRQGLVTERTQASPSGPARTVFTLSEDGQRCLARWSEQWVETTTTITELLVSAGALDNEKVRTDAPS